uniref:Uncharacterized protein n=1 Tax=Amphimedon queenslandica TaxID=400682 RepID=A0A1X7V141_AMPQE
MPSPSPMGLRMDDTTIRVAVGLRLRLPLCHPHSCCHCNGHVDELATDSFSCRRSQGRHFPHASITSVVHRAFAAAGIPSHLESSGLANASGKRPDGITMVPWKS